MSRIASVLLFSLLSLSLGYPSVTSADWIRRCTATAGADAKPTGVAVDGVGDVYVTGTYSNAADSSSFVLMKYDSDGNRKWLRTMPTADPELIPGRLPVMILDKSGNVYIWAPVLASDHLLRNIMKYDSDGKRKWVRRFGDRADIVHPGNIAADDGSVYVTGTCQRSVGESWTYKMITVKYDSSGTRKWIAEYEDPSGDTYWSSGLKPDAGGNLFVVGCAQLQDGSDADTIVLKYNLSGNLEWSRRRRSTWSFGSNPVTVDPYGNVLLVAYSRISPSGTMDFLTLKYDQLGNRSWLRWYNGEGNGDDFADAIVSDGMGNVYVTGQAGTKEGLATVTIKYDTNGVRKWIDTYGDHSGWPASRNCTIAADGSGNIYRNTTGFPKEDSSVIATIKISPNGAQEWVKTYNGRAGLSDFGRGVAVDDSGNVYVVGESLGPDYYADIVIIKYGW